tara:strand:+ start:26 stop:427 length:402 start_codon:yes stop_codon:yes gene_type:complete
MINKIKNPIQNKFPKMKRLKFQKILKSTKDVINTQNLKQPNQNESKNKFAPYVKDLEVRIHPGDNKTGCFFVTNNYSEDVKYKPMFDKCLKQQQDSLKPDANRYIKMVKIMNYRLSKRQENFIPEYYLEGQRK